MNTTEPHKRLRELIRQLERKTGALSDSQMACCNITMAQCHALIEIGRAGHISLIELSEALGLENSTISRTVNHLVNAGVASRETDPANRRYVIISLTGDGRRMFDGIEAGMSLYYGQILRKIPIEKQEKVLSGIQILLDAFIALEEEKS
ncbi:MAG: MarR family transcriptional regulator [Clostridiales bacterium]|jgi:DNA-binding MarR family transcriptional regulator|nr:MarR family transcriptional regulator [Clostridiales bacterium]